MTAELRKVAPSSHYEPSSVGIAARSPYGSSLTDEQTDDAVPLIEHENLTIGTEAEPQIRP